MQTRILFLIDKSGFGGIQTIAHHLQHHPRMHKNTHYFYIRNLDNSENSKKISYSKSKNIISIKPFFEIRKIIKQKNITLIHANGNKSILLAALLKKLLYPNITLIAHEHGGKFDYSWWWYRLVNLFGSQFNHIISLSVKRKMELLEHTNLKPHQIVVLYNFVDTSQYNPQNRLSIRDINRKKWGLNRDDFVVGYLGGLNSLKGWQIFAKSALLSKQTNCNNLKFLMFGAGPQQSNLEDFIISKKLQGKLFFAGFSKNPIEAYSAFDLLILPSISEAGPMVLFEAQASGIPTIVSDIPIFRELLTHKKNTFFFPKSNAVKLLDAILYLKDQKLLVEISKQGQKLARSHNIDSYMEKVTQLYLEANANE